MGAKSAESGGWVVGAGGCWELGMGRDGEGVRVDEMMVD